MNHAEIVHGRYASKPLPLSDQEAASASICPFGPLKYSPTWRLDPLPQCHHTPAGDFQGRSQIDNRNGMPRKAQEQHERGIDVA